MQRHHIGIALFTALLVAVLGYFVLSREAQAPVEEEGEMPVAETESIRIGEYALLITDQPPGNAVVVSVAALTSPGFVAVYAETNGEPGALVGVSQLLAPGEHSMLAVPLLETSIDGEVLVGKLFIDDGDGMFDAPVDASALDFNREPIEVLFTVDGQASAPEPIAI